MARDAAQRVPGANRLHHLDLLDEQVRPGTIRLVHAEHVGHLHEPGLHRLHSISGLRNQHDHRRIRGAGDLELGLADAQRLEDHAIEPEGIHQVSRLTRGRGEAAERAPARHGADEDVLLQRQLDHADPIAQKRSARIRARGIDGDDRHPASAVAHQSGKLRRQGRLPRPGRAGNADPPGAPDSVPQGFEQLLEARRLILHHGDGASQRAFVPGAKVLNQSIPTTVHRPTEGRRTRGPAEGRSRRGR